MPVRREIGHGEARHIVDSIGNELDARGAGAAVAVVDRHGELVAFLRTDGCPLPSINNAINKAFTAAREGITSRTLGERSREEGFPLSNYGDLRYIGWGGGVPIIIDGEVIGAVGVSRLPEAVDMELAQGARPPSSTAREQHGRQDMTKVRWGILSTADIGMEKVTPAIPRAVNAEVVAIASRDQARADAAAGRLGIPTAYGSYEALLAADDIDAVYIPLPNDLHAEWTVKAASAGKHVLCEKPLALSAAQAQTMAQACRDAGVLLAEAFMYRHHPSWVETVRLVRSGAIGDVQAVQSWFSYFNADPENIRNRVENGGGAIMDIGCYNINLSRLIFDAEPTKIEALVKRDPEMGIDTVSSALLEFPGERHSTFTCTTRGEDYQRVHIVGTTGRIEIEIPFNIPPGRETRIFVTAGGEPPTAPGNRDDHIPGSRPIHDPGRTFR